MITHPIYILLSDEDMQSVASLMSLGRVSDIGNSEDFDDVEEEPHNTSDDMTSKINELMNEFNIFTSSEKEKSVTNEPGKNPFEEEEEDSGLCIQKNHY